MGLYNFVNNILEKLIAPAQPPFSSVSPTLNLNILSYNLIT